MNLICHAAPAEAHAESLQSLLGYTICFWAPKTSHAANPKRSCRKSHDTGRRAACDRNSHSCLGSSNLIETSHVAPHHTTKGVGDRQWRPRPTNRLGGLQPNTIPDARKMHGPQTRPHMTGRASNLLSTYSINAMQSVSSTSTRQTQSRGSAAPHHF